MTAWYTNSFAGQPGQTARAEDVNNQFSGVQSAFALAQAQVGQCLQAPGTDPAVNTLPAAATRANKWLRFDANGQPLTVTTPFNVRGAWSATTSYNVGDAYTATPNGSLYYVTTAYTSGASFGNTDLSNTTVIVNLTGLVLASYNQVYTGPQTITAADGGSYSIDCTGGAVVVNLPLESALGNSPINIEHIGGSLSGSQTITINAATGQYIMGTTQSSMSVDVANASMTMHWMGAAYGWRLRTMG